jgi:glycosyltransferase involved in cell wall biosynthesis
MHPNLVLDFDDDLAAAKREPREISSFGRLLIENPTKFADSLRLYPRFVAGSTYLKGRVLGENAKTADEDIIIIPTCVDYANHPPKVYDLHADTVSFGWIGSAANHYLLDMIMPVLSMVAKKRKIRFVVITSDGYSQNADFEVKHVPWSLDTEIESLYRVDVGLMPLYDNPEERGKCGFKLIQYMGLGIVSIASAVTINTEIIENGENGFLVYDEGDWLRVIEEVLARRSEFSRIGAAARATIEDRFSFAANRKTYLDFIKAGLA